MHPVEEQKLRKIIRKYIEEIIASIYGGNDSATSPKYPTQGTFGHQMEKKDIKNNG